ncbi:MAG: MarR family winged helix-turn-helix transcriptional regulator [Coriobacteriales bacterium]|jgi:DNA-binding MarR family transcriptional regulator
MTIDNEELINQMQQVSSLIRRDRRAIAKEAGGERGHKASRGARGNHEHSEESTTPHGYGHHKSHGGSGHHGQNRVLATLMLKDGISQKDLAYLLAIRPQSLSQAVDKLEERGLVTRKQNDSDKRVSNVYLTDAGRQCAEKVAENRKVWADEVLEVLTEEEKEQLSSIMDKLEKSLKEQTEKFGSDRAED